MRYIIIILLIPLIYTNIAIYNPIEIHAQDGNINPHTRITIKPVIISDSPINDNVDIKTNTTTISDKELGAINPDNLDAVLEEQSGIYSFPTLHGKDIQMRGLNSEYIQFNIDGMPLIGRTAGIFDTEKISVRNSIEKIEIIKGPSLEYGSQAIAGVINIVTKPIVPGFYVTPKIKAGSFNTYDISLNTNYKNKSNGLSFFLNRYTTSGYKIKQNDNTQLQTTFPLRNNAAGIKYNFNNKNLDFTLNTLYSHELQFINQSSVNSLAKDNNLVIRANISPELTYTLNNNSTVKVKSYFTSFNNSTKTFSKKSDELLNESYFNEALYKINDLYDINFNKHLSFKLGLDDYYETLKATRYDNKVSRNTTRSFLIFYAKDLLNNKLEVSPGISYDLVSTPSTNFSPSFNLNYDFSKNLTANFYIAKGLALPAFRQLYMNFNNANIGYLVLGTQEIKNFIDKLEQSGNLDHMLISDINTIKYLQPEHSWNYSFGLTKKFSNIILTTNYFINRVTDLIEPIAVAMKKDNTLIYSYKNLRNIHIDGLDLNTSVYITPKMQAGLGFQYLNAYDIEVRKKAQNKHEKDYGLFNRSKYSGNIKFSYMLSKNLEASIRGIWRSKYGYIDQDGNGLLNREDEYLPGYFTVNAGIDTYLVQKKIKLNFSIYNLTDYTSPYLTTLTGRSFSVSIIYNYSNQQTQ
ncbi:MAG: TonB-dependent receptor plug domain-containing protein [Solitalea-like symbiont of Acarus siro]